MRVPLVFLAASLALAGCKKSGVQDNAVNVDENLTAENIVSNDVTAIDAVTGDAANMAADVDMNYGNLDENGSAESLNAPKMSTREPSKATKETTAPEPQANSETNSQ